MTTPEKRTPRFTTNEVARAACLGVAGVAALLSIIVCTLLIANYAQVRVLTPLDQPQLIELRRQLIESADASPALVQQIAALDLLARKAFFTSQEHIRTGAYLLLAGVGVLLAALRLAVHFKPRLPAPDSTPDDRAFWAARARGRWLIAGLGAAFAIAGLFAGFRGNIEIPAAPESRPIEQIQPIAAVEAAAPDWETMQKNWPSFRGPGACGIATYTTAPTDWDGAAGKNIKWKVEIPLPGRNSPVVWGNRIFITGANETAREVFCFDTETGALVWRRAIEQLPGASDKPPDVSEDTGFAPSTVVAHGTRVFAIFPTGDLACFDFEGTPLWAKNLGMPDNHYGHSSSLLAWDKLLFVQYDQAKNAKLLALDVSDGREVWTADRQYISWASPICAPTPFGRQLVLNSEKNVDAYDPVTGKLLWRVPCLDGEVAPSPAYGGGMIFVANEYAMATALRLTGSAEAPAAEVAWEWDEALPDISSPVGTDTHFYVATSMGYLICIDMATGKAAWGEEFDEGFSASPIVVGDRIYAADRAGITHIFKTGATYEALGSPPLGEEILATPAFLDGRIYFRTDKHLLCVARPDDAGK